MKAWALRELQKAYSIDYKVLGRLVAGYRTTVRIIGGSFIGGTILLLVLALCS